MSKKIKFEIAPEFSELESWVRQLPEQFPISGDSIYMGRNEVKVFNVGNYRLNVKAFRVPNWVNRFAYVYFRGSKASRSFQYARKFFEMGVNTPQAVGWLECHDSGLLAQSYYVSLHLNYDFTLREALKFEDRLKDEILHQWVRFTYEKLHQNGIFHLDYSPGNVLVCKKNNGFEFHIVDLNRMEFGSVDFKKGLYNFRQLDADRQIIEFLASEYALLCQKDVFKAKTILINFDRKNKRNRHRHDQWKKFFRSIFSFGNAVNG